MDTTHVHVLVAGTGPAAAVTTALLTKHGAETLSAAGNWESPWQEVENGQGLRVMESYEQDTDGVTVRLSGVNGALRADYIVVTNGKTSRDGRVFEADSVEDAFDLAWKLAAVLIGQAGPGLLDSYELEQRPAVEADGRPGSRAPHVWLYRHGAKVSTVDFIGTDWVLFTGAEGGIWHEAAKHVAERLGIEMTTVGLGPDLTDADGRFVQRYGIGHGGASLVRPDGVVAWRTAFEVDDAAGTLHGVLSRLLDRA